MKIQDLFLKPVDRPIEGVIKADDQRHLVTEVEEFVITREVGKGLDQFVERYLNETTANGVWISGFFGSGKSHLLKILSLLLDHRPLADGRHAKDIMLPRVEDEILKDNLIKAARIPAQSVLFNIDQKADHIGGDAMAPILEVLLDQASRYPFLESLRPIRDQISTMAGKDYAYLLNHLGDFETSLLEAKDDLLDPIKTFMHGSQRRAYDEAVSFLREEEANFADLPAEDIQPLRDLAGAEAPFRGDVVPGAKAAVAKLRKKIAALLGEEGAAASTVLDEHESKLQSLPDFAKLTEADAGRVLHPTDEARAAIASARFVTAIRDRLNRYRTQDYPAQLALLAHVAAAPPGKQDPGMEGSSKPDTPAPTYIPASALRPVCSLPFIGSEADLDQWLAALRAEAAKELKKGNRISL